MAKRVFVVDDEKPIADTMAIILRNSGYETTAFYCAEDAIEEVEVSCPDLIISDFAMPGMNGIEMSVYIRRRHPECKILLFSGLATTVNLHKLVEVHDYDFEVLAKPVHPQAMLARIAAILGG